MSEWLPIATAPKDGRHVILLIADDPPPYVGEGYYDADYGKWYRANAYPGDEWGLIACPTFWMPLPSPPEKGRGAA